MLTLILPAISKYYSSVRFFSSLKKSNFESETLRKDVPVPVGRGVGAGAMGKCHYIGLKEQG